MFFKGMLLGLPQVKRPNESNGKISKTVFSEMNRKWSAKFDALKKHQVPFQWSDFQCEMKLS